MTTTRMLMTTGAALLLLLSVACGDNDDMNGDGSAPRITAVTPLDGEADVHLNTSVTVTFSQPMDRATLTASTFTVTSGSAGAPVLGTVIYAGATATFWPAARLASNESYTATMSTGGASASGVALAASREWDFSTGTTVGPGLPVSLASAGDFVILAKSAISTVPTSVITGDLGVSPAAASYITGFDLTAHSSNAFSSSAQITGKVYAANYANPTPSTLTASIGDMELAFTDAAGRAPDVTELGAGNIGGMTLAPGVYKWGTGLLIPTSVTLAGDATSVWIFQIAQGLTVSSGASIVLTGGALAKNVFWQVSGGVEVGTTAHIEGVILGQTSITLRTGASVQGRLLAQTAVAIDGSTVVGPTP